MTSTSGHWSSLLVAGHECDIYEPPQLNAHGFVVLYLHGVHLNRLYDKQPFLSALDHHQLPLIAPFTQRSWWSDRICAEFDTRITAEGHVLNNILPQIQCRWGSSPPRIGLLGTSMGGQGGLRLAYKYPNRFPVVAAISPAIDYYLRFKEGDETLPLMYRDAEDARQDSAILHVHPLNWPRHQFFCCDPKDERWWDSSDRLRMKLASIGIPFECDLETTGGGHSFEYYNRMANRAIQFLADGLEKERRRVV